MPGLRTWLFTLACLLLVACSTEPPEAALRARIDQMQVAAEARDSAAVAEALSEEFAGPEGMDRDGFRRYLALVWLRNREVGVQLGPLDVALIGERATVEFTAAARGGEGWLPDRAQVYRVKTGWRLEDGEWKLLSASWEPTL
ncbi:nuclear transport factor 2 family protein [Arenimonas sp. MALMAid1274]|uniref:nuclear transport factor 2 family protein n=1 Tax=Arenimonas sp. MALMAid1274 TaxID=3411630 RepID=UPI003B9FD6CD